MRRATTRCCCSRGFRRRRTRRPRLRIRLPAGGRRWSARARPSTPIATSSSASTRWAAASAPRVPRPSIRPRASRIVWNSRTFPSKTSRAAATKPSARWASKVVRGRRRLAGRHGGAGLCGAVRRRGAPGHQHLRQPRGHAVRHRAALYAARRHPHGSGLAGRPVHRRRAPDHGHAARAQARHADVSLRRGVETPLRPPPGFRSPVRNAVTGPRAFSGRVRGAGLPERAGRQVRVGVRSQTAISTYRAPSIASISRRTAARLRPR